MNTSVVAAAASTGTSDILAPITETLLSNLGVLLPVGVGIMVIMIGVSLIPRIGYKFL